MTNNRPFDALVTNIDNLIASSDDPLFGEDPHDPADDEEKS